MPLAPTEPDNRMVWDRRPGHYEVWYATLSHRASRTGFWIRYTLEAPRPGQGEPYAQLWFARFDHDDPTRTFGINRKLPIAALVPNATPFSIAIGDAVLRHDGMRGALSGDGHEARWDLRLRPAQRMHRLLPDFAYTLPVDTRVVSPNLDVAFSGEIVVDGVTYRLDDDPGGQTHVWGRKHAYAWAWAHCNAFVDELTRRPVQATFEGLSVRVKRGQLVSPLLTLFTLFLDGEEIVFREAADLPFTRSEFTTSRYTLSGAGASVRVEATFTSRPDDMVMAEYVDPDGDPAFCHNTCCGDVRVVVSRRGTFDTTYRHERTLVAPGLAHWEWGARAGDAVNVKKHHRTLV